jgi:hypothetical protein
MSSGHTKFFVFHIYIARNGWADSACDLRPWHPVFKLWTNCIFFFFLFTSARIRMPKYWIHAKNKIFVHPLFMTFLDVIEVPEHDKAIKNLVSVCLCRSSRLLHFFTILQRSRWCQNLWNFIVMKWLTFEVSRVTVSWRAWQKRHFFRLFLRFFNFFDIFVDCWAHICCSW